MSEDSEDSEDSKDRAFWKFHLAKKNTRMSADIITANDLPYLYRQQKEFKHDLTSWNQFIRTIRANAGRELNAFENTLADELDCMLDSGDKRNLKSLAALAKTIVSRSSASDQVTLAKIDSSLTN